MTNNQRSFWPPHSQFELKLNQSTIRETPISAINSIRKSRYVKFSSTKLYLGIFQGSDYILQSVWISVFRLKFLLKLIGAETHDQVEYRLQLRIDGVRGGYIAGYGGDGASYNDSSCLFIFLHTGFQTSGCCSRTHGLEISQVLRKLVQTHAEVYRF